MPAFCCVVGCGSRQERDKVQFFRIPSVTKFKHREDLNQLSVKRRAAWLEAIKRQDFSESKLKNARICSKHFISGHPANLKDSSNPDWIPTLKMEYEKPQISSGTAKMERFKSKEKGSEAVAAWKGILLKKMDPTTSGLKSCVFPKNRSEHRKKNAGKIEEKQFSCQDSIPEYSSNECSFSTNLRVYFIQHLKKFHLKKEEEETPIFKTYMCQECCSFWTYSSLVLLRHQTKKCYSRTTKNKKEIVTYILPSNTTSLFTCNDCNYKTKIQRYLNYHIKIHHTQNIQWLNCDQCDYKTKKVQILKRHLYSKHNRNTGVTLHSCDHCEYRTLDSYHLKTHLYTKHSCDVDVKWYRCDQCEYKTINTSNLKQHKIYKHKTDKVEFLRCGFCDYKTIDWRNLKRHVKGKHTEVKWHKCDQCEYTAKTLVTIRRHKTNEHKAKASS